MPFELADDLTGGQIPEQKRLIIGAGERLGAVRGKRHALDNVGMSAEDAAGSRRVGGLGQRELLLR